MSDETIITSIESLGKKTESEKKPYLTCIKGAMLGQIYPIDKTDVFVGRSTDCEICVPDSTISRRHFKIIQKNPHTLFVEDLKSTNGTYVNGNRVEKAKIKEGDKIQISRNTILELHYLDDTESLSEKQRYEMGVLDPLTNVYNKRFLLERLNDEFHFAKRRKDFLSVVMIDIDYFKKINDTYGHLVGDVVLQKMASHIAKEIRLEDIFGRFGGEEFVIIMRGANTDAAIRLADRLREDIAGLEFPNEGKPFKVTISAGVATVGEQHTDSLHLLSEADKYLYAAKNAGRNRVCGPEKQ